MSYTYLNPFQHHCHRRCKTADNHMMANPDEIELKQLVREGCFGAVYKGIYREVAVEKIRIPSGVSKETILINSWELAALK